MVTPLHTHTGAWERSIQQPDHKLSHIMRELVADCRGLVHRSVYRFLKQEVTSSPWKGWVERVMSGVWVGYVRVGGEWASE